MRLSAALALLCALVGAAVLAFAGNGTDGSRVPSAAEILEEAREETKELQLPSDVMLAQQLFGSDDVAPHEVFRRALRQRERVARATAAAAPGATAAPWQLIGPTNIGGRILDVTVDPERKDTIFAAAASGGIWKSADKGQTFTPAWPADYPQSMGSLVQTKSGRLIVGTGESGPGGGSLTYGGTGVYASDDRGETWKSLGLENTSRIGRVIVDPTDEKRIFVAASGPLYKPGGDRGLYRSEDGGKTWKRVLEGANATTGVIDVAIDPKNPKRMIAATWDHQRTPDVRRYNGIGSGVWRSTDGGSTWEQIGPPVLLGTNPQLGRIGVAIAPSQPDTIYVVASGLVGGFAGFYVSTDFGQTFQPRVHPLLAAGPLTYGWWFGRVWVDPEDAQRIFVAGLDLLESPDGGLTFAAITGGMHVDQHALAWDPKVKDRIYAGNDGGVYRSDDDAASWEGATYQPWVQPYSVDVSQQDPKRVVAGLQDNGTARSYPGRKQGIWNFYGPGGDGTETAINPKDHDIVYGCAQNGACEVSYDGGDTGTSFENSVVETRKGWLTPIEFDPDNPSTVYHGGEIINRSDDDGRTWTPISPDLSNGGGTETNPLYANGYGTVTTISAAPQESGTIYAGTDDGNLWYTHSGGGLTGWTRAVDSDLPKAWVTRVRVDPKNDDVAYATFSGFRTGDHTAYVVKTTDGGKSWTNITGNLPHAPYTDVRVIGDAIVVSGDVGVFATRNGGAQWFGVGKGLPLAPITELREHLPSNSLYAANFGRGVWKVSLDALKSLPKAKLRLTPARRSCARPTALGLRVRAPKGYRLRSATVKVNGRTAKRLKGSALRRVVKLRVPRGKLRVSVAAVATDGTKLSASRRYAACRR